MPLTTVKTKVVGLKQKRLLPPLAMDGTVWKNSVKWKQFLIF